MAEIAQSDMPTRRWRLALLTFVAVALVAAAIAIPLVSEPPLECLAPDPSSPPRKGDVTYVPPPLPATPEVELRTITKPLRQFGPSDFRLATSGSSPQEFRFSADGTLLAATNGRDVKLWSFPDGRLLHNYTEKQWASTLEFEDNGNVLIVLRRFRYGRIALDRYNNVDGSFVRRVELKEVVEETSTSYRFSTDGQYLVSIDQHTNTTVWTTTDGKQLFRRGLRGAGHANASRISEGGVLTVWDDISLAQYDLRTGDALHRGSVYLNPIGIAADAKAKLMAGYFPDDASIQFFKPPSKDQVVARLVGPEDKRQWGNSNPVLSDDGTRFAYWRWNGPMFVDRQIEVVNTSDGTTVMRFDHDASRLFARFILSPNGSYLLPIDDMTEFGTIDVPSGKFFTEFIGHATAIAGLSFTPDGRTLIVSSRDKRQAWEVDTGARTAVFEGNNTHDVIEAVDNEFALDRRGLLYEIASGTIAQRYDAVIQGVPRDNAISADRKSFVGIGGDGDVWVIGRYSIETGEVLDERRDPQTKRSGKGIWPDTFSPLGFVLNGTHVARIEPSPYERLPENAQPVAPELIFEDWSARRVTHRFPLPSQNVRGLATSEDGAKVFAIVWDGDWQRRAGKRVSDPYQLIVWDLANSKQLDHVELNLAGIYGAYHSLTLSPDGAMLATLKTPNCIELWSTSPLRAIRQIQSEASVTSMAFTPDGSQIAAGHDDGSIWLWSVE